MDLKLKITQKEGTSMSSLVKQMCALKCRVKVDTQEGDISIVGMNVNSIENVIDSIDEAFNIVGVDIVPNIEDFEPVIEAPAPVIEVSKPATEAPEAAIEVLEPAIEVSNLLLKLLHLLLQLNRLKLQKSSSLTKKSKTK